MLYLGVRKLLEFEPKSQNETRIERSKEDLAITNEVLIRREFVMLLHTKEYENKTESEFQC